MPIHSLHWKAFASSLDNDELFCEAMAWLCGDPENVDIEKTSSYHGSDIHIISVDITRKGLARKALARLGEEILQQILDDLDGRIDEENCLHVRIYMDELACGRIVLAPPGEKRTVKGKIKLQIYPGDEQKNVASKLLNDAIINSNRNTEN